MVKKMNKPHTLEMDWWEEKTLGSGIKLVCLPTQHWSMRINQGRNKSLWVAWLLITPSTTFYFGGDTGYFKGFKETRKKYPDIDYAFIATTAYHPRWFMHYQHMNIRKLSKVLGNWGQNISSPPSGAPFTWAASLQAFRASSLNALSRPGTLIHPCLKLWISVKF